MISRESFARDGPAVTEPGRVREQSPSLGLDGSGNAVVAYQKSVAGDFDIKARRVSAGGTVGAGTVGVETNIQNTGADETHPSVAVRKGPAGGAFVGAYDSSSGVKVTGVSATNAVLSTSSAGSLRGGPAVRIDDSGEYLVTYSAVEVQTWGLSGIGTGTWNRPYTPRSSQATGPKSGRFAPVPAGTGRITGLIHPVATCSHQQ
jgi:hypothetical protein